MLGPDEAVPEESSRHSFEGVPQSDCERDRANGHRVCSLVGSENGRVGEEGSQQNAGPDAVAPQQDRRKSNPRRRPDR